MLKAKIDKEQPRYRTQKQLESAFKQNYAKALLSMNETIIRKITTQTQKQNG